MSYFHFCCEEKVVDYSICNAPFQEEYWAHARTHIKDDKVLQCPKCPFVTEYKHHLEYHLRNHFGSKPFKCTKCNYSCVNKSMLNSHMKSHTTVYQYRCADCTYATKYCHSLKLHLQKYNHTPALVLNPDGSLPTDGSGDFELVSKRGPPRGPRGPRKSLERELSPGNPLARMEPGLMMPHPGMNGHNPLNVMAAAGAFWPGMFPNGLQPPPPLIPMNALNVQMPEVNRADSAPPTPQDGCQEKLKCKLCEFPADNRHVMAEHMIKCHGTEHREISRMFSLTENPMAAMAAAAAAKVAEQQNLLKAQGLMTPNKDPQAMVKAWAMMHQGGPHPFLHASPPTPHTPVTPLTPRSQSSPRCPDSYSPHNTPNKAEYKQLIAMEIARKVQSEGHGENGINRMGESPLDLTNKNEINGVPDFSPGAKRRLYDEEESSQTGPTDSNPNTPMDIQNGNRSPPRKRSRKGKAYKLDVLSMKLQERYSASSPGPDFDESGDEEPDYPSDYPSIDSNEGTKEVMEDGEPDYSALHDSIRALSGERFDKSPREGDDHPEEPTTEKMDVAAMFSISMNRKKVLMERHQLEENGIDLQTEANSSSIPRPDHGGQYECQHCDISFRDCIMYTMHMGYHGYHNPFKCNMCGQTSKDKVEFFLHVARTAHE